MAIVNGIVTVIKAIINVSKIPLEEAIAALLELRILENQTNTPTTGHRRLLLPPRQLPHLRQGRRPEKDNQRSLNAATFSRQHTTVACN
jgi:hypothetical protein